MIKQIIALSLVSSIAGATSVKILSDNYPPQLNPKPTICQVFIDATAGVDTPTVTDATGGPRCEGTVGPIQPGDHTAKAKFAYVDPTGKRVESQEFSNTVNFTIAPPVQISKPTGLRAIVIP